MRILITGVNGFVGNALFHFFDKKGIEVFGTYRSGKAINSNCFNVDLLNETEVNNLFNISLKDKIDVVIHTASVMAKTDNLEDLAVINDNSKMAKNLAIAIKENNSKQFINISSSSVYPNVDSVFSETSELNPAKNADCFYGLSKLNSEIIFDYYFEKSNLKILHLRTAIVYGKGMDSTRLIPVLENELSEKNTLTLYANGERFVNQIYIDKLCSYIYLFALKQESGIFNVGDEYVTTKEIAERIIHEKGNKNSRIILLPHGNKNLFKLDLTKLKNWLNVQAS
ncbi:MAG: NAD-dependent epimerase/dehydratase family protein [Bacteroidota bacterium]